MRTRGPGSRGHTWRALAGWGFGLGRRAARLLAVAAVLVLTACGSGDEAHHDTGRPFVPSLGADRATLWAVGDGSADERGGAMVDRLAAGPLDRLLYLGDVYDDGTREEFFDGYASTYGRLASRTAPTPGNHDWPNEAEGYTPYWSGVRGSPAPGWYAFRAGGWEVLSLNSQEPHDEGSAQERWLREQVRAGGTCRIAFWHRPRFSAGEDHGDQDDMEPLWDALRGRATIVLSGHEHNMQRFAPVDGLTQFVSGAGGRSLYDLEDPSRLAFGNASDDGALRLDLRPGSATFAFVAVDGRVLDRGVLRCRS
ncbi:MAG: metallophosphoesterase [Actinomycetota bacterium]|nr:metallophosphoesterase [Actinomycetota bacterium]